MDTDEDTYHAAPQTKGKLAHKGVDTKTSSTSSKILMALSIVSNELKVYGKIDTYNKDTETLVERKYNLKTIYLGQIYQLWAQYFCMTEMGYNIKAIAFYEIATNKMKPISIPTERNKTELKQFIKSFIEYNPENNIEINENKCKHCIYSSLCDKVNYNNVYT